MSAGYFLEGVQRFITRRIKPDKVVLDNATYFKVGKKMIDMASKDIIFDPQVHRYFSEKRIKWSFINELSHGMYVFYERLFRTTKITLRKKFGLQHFKQIRL